MFVLPANPYEILGVAKTAQIPEIRQAHRKLVLKCHPDKVSDPQQKAVKAEEFQKVQRAYEMLSNETERQKYDDMVRANQMEEENKRRRAEQAASYPTPGRTPPRTEPEAATYPAYNVKVRTAEPPSFMRSNTMPSPAKGGPYSTRTPSHSYEEFSPDESREPRSAKKSAPTYERESKREEEKRRKKKEDEEWERQLRKQEQRKREEAREKERRDKEKERERREKEKRRAERAERAEKDRKRDTDDKRGRSKQPYVEVQPVDDERERELPPHIVDAAPKTDKTPKSKSTSRPKHEHVVSDHEGLVTGGAADKHRQNLDTAIQYLENMRSKGKTQQQAKTPLTRAATYHPTAPTYARQMPPPAVETPPPANHAVAPPPPPPPQPSSRPVYADEETVRRSSAKPSARRMSHDTPRPRDKIFASTSHKKSSRQQASDDEFRSPPPLKKSMTMPAQKHYAPPEVPESPPKMHRAQTDSYSRPIPSSNPPAMSRSHTHTWYAAPSAEEDSYRPRRYHTTDDDSEDERPRRGRRARSPEPVTRTSAVRYHVVPPTDGRAPRTRAMSPRSKPPKTSYYASAEEPSWDSRPSYDAYDAGGGSGGYYPPKVKYSSYENPIYSNSAYKATEHPASVYGF